MAPTGQRTRRCSPGQPNSEDGSEHHVLHRVAQRDRGRALQSEGAPELNVHNTGGFNLLAVVGLEPDRYGTLDATDFIARIGSVTPAVSDDYLAARLPVLRTVALAAHRLGRQVVWG